MPESRDDLIQNHRPDYLPQLGEYVACAHSRGVRSSTLYTTIREDDGPAFLDNDLYAGICLTNDRIQLDDSGQSLRCGGASA